MPEPPLSPSQQVERIREILVGRQMQLVEERLERLELLIGDSPIRKPGSISTPFPSNIVTADDTFVPDKPSVSSSVNRDEEINALHSLVSKTNKQLDEANEQLGKHERLLSQDLRQTLEDLNASVAERIDARCQEVLSHLESQLKTLRDQLTEDLKRVEKMKADRSELQARLSRIAEAAQGDSSLDPSDGYTP